MVQQPISDHEWRGSAPRRRPRSIGGYEVLEAERAVPGAQSTVYKARDPRTGKLVALKVLEDPFASFAQSLFAAFLRDSDEEELRREARLLSTLEHPNVVKVFGSGEDPEYGTYEVMEWVEGRDLESVLRERGPLSPAEAVGICREVLRGLEAVHRAGIVHRDVKPANILLDGSGHAKLCDFGVAGLVERGAQEALARGTPLYMAPEQRDPERAKEIGPAADIYAVGAVLFEMVTGRPYRAPADLASAALLIPGPLRGVIARAMQERPEDRFASAGEMEAALAGFSSLSL
ncbi:MAG: serine/threonine protein kinase [Chloroflexi bacterium]|nr:serine/threonine protein kinase [Chloroflexota bacterium]